ncbi:hypothetical protein A3K62_01890 [Candidatus Pacearchaeota archaeon RBG_16_35_8]|nr:MAG: hypothetical protein A3K62_01890 [Candidatus Pacearchaeota archaeon RBG_16_35_8]
MNNCGNVNFGEPYTQKDFDLIYDFFVNKKTFSELEKTLGRKGSAIINKMQRLRRKEPGKWEAAYQFYLKGYNELHGEEVRREDRKQNAQRKSEIAAMVEQITIHEGEVRSFDITIN